MPENHAHPVSDLSIWGGHHCEQVLSLSAPLSAKDLDRALWPFLTLPRFFSVILPLATTGWFEIMRQSWIERHRTDILRAAACRDAGPRKIIERRLRGVAPSNPKGGQGRLTLMRGKIRIHASQRTSVRHAICA